MASDMDVDDAQTASPSAPQAAPQEKDSSPRKSISRDPTARRRTARLACDYCHKKKTKCDGSYPCSNCKKRHIDCLWAGGAPVKLIAGSYTPEYVKWLEERVAAIDERKDRAPAPHDRIPCSPPAGVTTAPVGLSRPTWEAGPRLAVADEVAGVNRHTNDQEFYGSSSSVALLARVGRSPSGPGDVEVPPRQDEPDALLTSLHNPVFSRGRARGGTTSKGAPAISFFPECRVFLDGFFSTLHYIFPILDKTIFMRRCENLWLSDGSGETSQFVALYFSILSLGALVGPRLDEPIGGRDNLAWSRKFREESASLCSAIGMATDLEMVQCYFFLSKVCQNELNPHLTYMYVGLAVRTALAIGINRSPPATSKKDLEVIKAETRTWWGLYSLETELSFGMGRPDTLGGDLDHNRPFPATVYSRNAVAVTDNGHNMMEPAQCAILESMVGFSRIIRRIHLQLYVPESPMARDSSGARRYAATCSIEQELDVWLANLPDVIRPQRGAAPETSLKSVREPQYAKKQKLVLAIRYHNLRILLFGSFLLRAANRRGMAPAEPQRVQKSLDSAKATIDIIYETYRHNDFFRTWFYNTTYIVFASSMILLYMAQSSSDGDSNELQALGRYVEMAVEILEVMDESVIAAKSAGMIKRGLERVRAAAAPPPSVAPTAGPDVEPDLWLPAHHYWGSVNLLDGGLDESFLFQLESWP